MHRWEEMFSLELIVAKLINTPIPLESEHVFLVGVLTIRRKLLLHFPDVKNSLCRTKLGNCYTYFLTQ